MNELKNQWHNYYTEFSCEKIGEEGRDVKMNHYVCFSADGGGFTRYRGEQKFKLRIYKGFKKLNENYSHLCIFTLNEIIEHIEALYLVIDEDEFKFENIVEDSDRYEINFRVKSNRTVIFGYVLTWIRYLYETPYCLALHESFMLKDIYKTLDPFSRFNLARTTFPDRGYCLSWGTGHSATKKVDTLMSTEDLKKRIHQEEVTNLASIYKNGTGKNSKLFLTFSTKSDKYDGTKDLEFWMRKDEFDKRLDIYNKNLKNYGKEKA